MKDRIAHHLGLHPADVHPLQKPILRILSDGSRPSWLGAAGRGGLRASPAVGGAGDDEPVERLHTPAVLHKLDSEPVEQLRMGRSGSSPAEIEHARQERLVEVPHPNMVHGHPCRERIVPIGDPAGQRRTPPRARRRIGRGDPRVGAIGGAHRRAPRGFHRSQCLLDRCGRGDDLRLSGGVGLGLGPRRGKHPLRGEKRLEGRLLGRVPLRRCSRFGRRHDLIGRRTAVAQPLGGESGIE